MENVDEVTSKCEDDPVSSSSQCLILDTRQPEPVAIESKVGDNDQVISDEVMDVPTDTCMFCEDSYFNVSSRAAYSEHVREVHKVTKNVDILIEFIIDKNTRGNFSVFYCCDVVYCFLPLVPSHYHVFIVSD